MIRCCLCRNVGMEHEVEPTDLPGSGFRCVDRYACSERVKAIIDAHEGLADACDEIS